MFSYFSANLATFSKSGLYYNNYFNGRSWDTLVVICKNWDRHLTDICWYSGLPARLKLGKSRQAWLNCLCLILVYLLTWQEEWRHVCSSCEGSTFHPKGNTQKSSRYKEGLFKTALKNKHLSSRFMSLSCILLIIIDRFMEKAAALHESFPFNCCAFNYQQSSQKRSVCPCGGTLWVSLLHPSQIACSNSTARCYSRTYTSLM